MKTNRNEHNIFVLCKNEESYKKLVETFDYIANIFCHNESEIYDKLDDRTMIITDSKFIHDIENPEDTWIEGGYLVICDSKITSDAIQKLTNSRVNTCYNNIYNNLVGKKYGMSDKFWLNSFGETIINK